MAEKKQISRDEEAFAVSQISPDSEIKDPAGKSKKLYVIIGIILLVIAAGLAAWHYWPQAPAEENPPIKHAAAAAPEPESKPAQKIQEPAALTEGQRKFSDIFNETLLRDALSNAGKSFDLAMFRNMIRIAMNAQFIGNRPGMTWNKWEKERERIRKLARKELADPLFLKRLWARYGRIVVQAVKASGKSAQVRSLCRRAIPYFSGELPHSRFVQLNNYYNTDAKLEREIQKRKYSKEAIHKLTGILDKKYRLLKQNGMDDTDIYLFEFSMRRIHEGGRELAKAYADILSDLNQSL
ncbi:MAG: hypothetical protein GXO69_07445 [Acidobacteria bacterium]|nr:hypothetical protein [Acidobacteriota bacterium]